MTRFISLISGKGGTGKTTVAINLATALSNKGRIVTILDTNLGVPSVAAYLGYPANKVTLHDVLSGTHTIHQATYLHPSGIRVIPASTHPEDPNADYPTSLNAIFLSMIGETEVCIIDTPPGFNKRTLEALDASDEVIIVTNPDTHSITDAVRSGKIAAERGASVIGVVLNKTTKNSHDENYLQQLFQKNILTAIPDDKAIPQSLEKHHPVLYSHPRSPSSLAFKKLADLIDI